jgi:hypothetical protein
MSSKPLNIFYIFRKCYDRIYGPVVRGPGYRSRDPGFDSRRYKIFWVVVGLERGLLRLLLITEELPGKKWGPSRKLRLTAVVIRWADQATPSTRKSRHYFAGRGGWSVGIVRLRTKSHGVCFEALHFRPFLQWLQHKDNFASQVTLCFWGILALWN